VLFPCDLLLQREARVITHAVRHALLMQVLPFGGGRELSVSVGEPNAIMRGAGVHRLTCRVPLDARNTIGGGVPIDLSGWAWLSTTGMDWLGGWSTERPVVTRDRQPFEAMLVLPLTDEQLAVKLGIPPALLAPLLAGLARNGLAVPAAGTDGHDGAPDGAITLTSAGQAAAASLADTRRDVLANLVRDWSPRAGRRPRRPAHPPGPEPGHRTRPRRLNRPGPAQPGPHPVSPAAWIASGCFHIDGTLLRGDCGRAGLHRGKPESRSRRGNTLNIPNEPWC
jgi:hypothetical protein